MADYLGLAALRTQRGAEERVDSRNGYYERDYVTALGPIRFRVRRTRKRSFLPRGIAALRAARAGSGRDDPASFPARDFHARRWGGWWRC